jgi:hypothetical protein
VLQARPAAQRDEEIRRAHCPPMTSEVMDSGSPFSDTADVAITGAQAHRRQQNEKERFQSVVRSVVVVLSFSMVGEH